LTKLEDVVVEEIQVMDESAEVKINELIGEFYPRVTDVTSFWFIVVATAW